MRINVVTLFPEFFAGPLGVSIVGRALDEGLVEVETIDLREHGLGPHRQVDDAPFGGGPGMVMMIEPLAAALDPLESTHRILLTPAGRPLDTFGRNLYLDTFNSAYGRGWRRENGFLSHVGSGGFCYGFYPHGSRPSGMGERYRLSVSGPGVLPDVSWEGQAPRSYDRAVDLAADRMQEELLANDRVCRAR